MPAPTTTTRITTITDDLANRGFTLTSVEVKTPDGRTWSIDAARNLEDRTKGSGGYRLFETDPEGRRGPEEHDAVEGDTWSRGDLLDYLEAVGQPKPAR